jgi:hypothetical protein
MDLIGDGTAKGATVPGSTSPAEGAMVKLTAAIDASTTLPPPVKKALQTLADASQNPAKMRENVENWFDSSMDRVSGFYKRRSQLIVLLLGLALAILLNVDSVALVRVLSTDRAMRDSLVAAAAEYARNNPTPPANSSSANTNASAPNGGGADPKSTTTSNLNPASGNSNRAASKNGNSSPPTAAGNANGAGAKNQNSTSGSANNSNQSTTNTNSSSSGSPTTAGSPKPTPTPGCDTPECRVKENLSIIQSLGLPIGWNRSDPPDTRSIYASPGHWALRVLGWLITALALSLGAPFWFDLLNKFMVIRSTVKPKEKSPDEPSKG